MSILNETTPHKFINPYNFIPLSDSCAESVKEKGTYTGVIAYSVWTKTPLFIPNTSNDSALRKDVKDHKSYEFFSYTDLSNATETIEEPDYIPVIPGSEMRGMLRSYYEILTNSCMSAVDDTVTLGKRTNQTYEAGLIKKTGSNTYDLYRAEDCLMRTKGENNLEDDWKADNEHYTRRCYVQKDLKEGQKVFFEYSSRQKGKSLALNVSLTKSDNFGKRIRTGYVIKGEDGPQMGSKQLKQQKHCCHIFTEKELYKEKISLVTLKLALKKYKDNDVHPYKEYAERLKAFEEGEAGAFFPVYYSEVPTYYNKAKSMHLMLSPACITREIYGRTLREMIGTHLSCREKDKLCPACALFGTIGGDFARTSRIRVADLVCMEPEAKECYEEPVTLAPLSSPKLNNMEFYLKRPKDAWFWTYDYYIDNNGIIHENREGINGRKFYWHQPDVKLENQKAGNLNITIRPLKRNITFKGKLYFRNLTKTELDQLIYLLKAGDEKEELSEKTHGYKLGGGKPLGLGSIAVSVDQVMIRSYEKDADKHIVERKESTYDSYSVPEIEGTILRNFTKMTDFNAIEGGNISYPRTEESGDIFGWFISNHKGYKYDKRSQQNIITSMPNARKQMVYVEYMEPMIAGLVSTGFCEKFAVRPRGGGQYNNGRHSSGSCGSKNVIDAVVTGINHKNGNVYVSEKEDPSKKGHIGASFLKGQKPQKGDVIKVRLHKTYDDGHNVYNIEL